MGNVICDKVHLMLRIKDVLVRKIIDEARELDKLNGAKDAVNGPTMRELVAAVRSCGISFNVWPKLHA